MKHFALILLAALTWSVNSLFGQFPLSVESYPAVQEGKTTYRFYVNMQDATDRMSAVYGNNEAELSLSAPEGVYNSAFNASWNASGITPAFLLTFPELADDTYATIGLTGPAATSGIPGAADPSIVEDSAQPISPFFQTDGSTGIESNTLTGSAWYISNTAANGLPDENLQVLILQVTTAGGLSGTLNYQVFPLGVGANDVLMSESFNVEPEDVEGCTDEASCTYNPEATLDDGSCLYLDAIGVCGGDCEEASPDSPSVCSGDEVYGCTNLDACNYDPAANISDGSCVGTPDNFCDCDGTVPDSDNDGICDEDEIEGCTDGMACNYDSAATDDDGSCEYCSCGESAFTLTVDTMAATQEGLTTYRVCVNTLSATDRVSAVFSNVDYPMTINVPEGAWNSPYSTTWNASGVNPALLIPFPTIADDSYATIGLTGPAAPLGPGYDDPLLVDGDMMVTNLFSQDGNTGFTSDMNPGVSWFILPTALNGLPDANGRVLLMQITTAGSINGTLNYQVFPQGNQAADITMTTTFDGVGTFGQVNVCGCDGNGNQLDALGVCGGDCAADADSDGICDDDDACVGAIDACGICNGPGAVYDCGCSNIPEGDCDCDGNQLDALGVCGGDCAADADSDGICDDEDDCVGAIDACGICNGPGAVYDCGCSNIPEGDCDCEGNQLDVIGVCGGSCVADEDGDGICDDCIWLDGYHLELEVVKEHTEGELAGMTTYQLFVKCLSPADYVQSVSGSASFPMIIESSSGEWYNHPLNESWNASGIEPLLVENNPLLAYDSYLTIGSSNSEEGPFPSGLWTGIDPRPEFQPGGGNNLVVDEGSGSNYLNFPGLEFANSHPGFAGEDLRVLLMQLTTVGSIEGQVNVWIYPNGQGNQNSLLTLGWDSLDECFNLDECVGEVDECGVCNGPGATYDCGCASIPEGECDCEGTMIDALGICGGSCVEDADADGVCDVDEVLGCANVLACNYEPEATEDDGSCFLPPSFYRCDGSCVNDSDSDGVCDELSEFDYSLVVESSPSATDVGTTYRFYVQMEDATDRMSAVFGTDSMNLKILAPSGVFNCPYNLGWNAAGINPAFLPVFPELVDDSYATIGLTGPASSSGMANAADPALVEDPAQLISPFFVEPNQTTLLSSTLIGASWYVLNTAANGLPDENGRVLVMQVTTAGPLYGTLNYQVFPLGQQGVERRLSADFLGEGVFAAVAESVLGCTDEGACNFDPNATTDDGSCTQFDECGLCGGPGIPAGECDCEGTLIDDCGVCGGDNTTCAGCTSPVACNYDASALVADLSLCVFATGPCEICGGNASDGTGYVDPNDEDGDFICNDVDTCLGDLDAIGVCNGSCTADVDSDGICDDVDDCVGAFDACGICNGPGEVFECGCAGPPEGDCDCEGNVEDVLGVCGGECLEDANENGICDALEALEFPLVVVASPAVASDATVYRFYIQMSGPTQRMSAVFGTNEFPMYLQAPGGVFNSPYNQGWNAAGINPAFLPVFPELVDDSYATVGLSGPAAFSDIANAEDPSKVEDTNQMFTPFFTNDGSQSVTMDSFVGGSWYVLNSAGNGFPDEDGRVLIMQLTTEGLVAGKINYQLFPVPGYDRQESVVFSGEGTFFPYEDPTFGCTDLLACNYDPLASDDDGTCLQFDECGVCDGPGIALGDCDCEGNQLDAIGVCGGDCEVDMDEDGVCDSEDPCIGFFDDCAVCNGPGLIYECGCSDIPEGDCDCEGNQLDALGVCGGDCPEDEDGDGICDNVCNDIPEGDCDCEGNQLDVIGVCGGDCLHDENGDGICDGEGEYSLTIEAYPAVQEGLVTYRFFVNMVNSTDRMSAVFGNSDFEMYITTPEGAYNHSINPTWNAEGINPSLFAFFPELADDTYATIGLTGPASASDIVGAEQPALVEDSQQPIAPFFYSPSGWDGFTSGFESNSSIGAAWYILNTAANGFPNEDMQVLILQVTTAGSVTGKLNCQVFPQGDGENAVYLYQSFNVQADPDFPGCTDEEACNYDDDAMVDDGTCSYPDECGVCGGEGAVLECGCSDIPEGYCDCDGGQFDAVGVCGGDCEYDTNSNGICDFDELQGPQSCGWGTVWNADSAACVLAVPPFLGEFGDYNTLNPCYYDLDLSGSVGAGDLINFLSTYGLETGCSWTDE